MRSLVLLLILVAVPASAHLVDDLRAAKRLTRRLQREKPPGYEALLDDLADGLAERVAGEVRAAALALDLHEVPGIRASRTAGRAADRLDRSRDVDSRRRRLRLLRGAVAGARKTFRVLRRRSPDEATALKYIIANLQAACEYAGKKGVMLGIENHDFAADVGRMLKIVRGVDSPFFGVTFDSGNFHSADPYADLAKIAPYAVNAQIKVHMRPAGKPAEEADLKRIITILRDANYSGYVTLEYEAKEDPYTQVPKYIDKLRAAIAS